MSDRLTLLQKEGESYEKHEETPTISFIGANENLTLPYIHLQWMRRDLKQVATAIETASRRLSQLHGWGISQRPEIGFGDISAKALKFSTLASQRQRPWLACASKAVGNS